MKKIICFILFFVFIQTFSFTNNIMESMFDDLKSKNDKLELVLFFTQQIQYKSDLILHGVEDYWQSPEETARSGIGDCEDFVILAMFLCYKYAKIYDPKMVIVKLICRTCDDEYHAILEIDGIWYETITGDKVSDKTKLKYEYSATLDLFDVLRIVYTNHNVNIEESE